MSQAILVRETGSAAVLKLEEYDPGSPASGQVRVRVMAAGVNFIDVYFRTGLYPSPLPFVLGREGAGIVDVVGPDVNSLQVGDRVCWAMVPGAYADAVLIPESQIIKIPDGVSEEQAAAVMLQGMTAHYLVHGTRTTRSGDMALVHAAAGGVGLLLIQMLKQAGATVFGTCSTEEKAALAQEAGADKVINYTTTDFADEVKKLTNGRGVDVVYDSVGQSTFNGSLRSLRPRGLLALFGQSSGPVSPFDLGQLNPLGSLFVTRPSLVHYIRDRAELELRAHTVLELVASKKLEVRIGNRFPLADAAEAHRALEGRRTVGKVVLNV